MDHLDQTSKLGLPCLHPRPPFVTKGTKRDWEVPRAVPGATKKRETAAPSIAERGTPTFTFTGNALHCPAAGSWWTMARPKAVRIWLLGLSLHQFGIAMEYLIRSVEWLYSVETSSHTISYTSTSDFQSSHSSASDTFLVNIVSELLFFYPGLSQIWNHWPWRCIGSDETSSASNYTRWTPRVVSMAFGAAVSTCLPIGGWQFVGDSGERMMVIQQQHIHQFMFNHCSY